MMNTIDTPTQVSFQWGWELTKSIKFQQYTRKKTEAEKMQLNPLNIILPDQLT